VRQDEAHFSRTRSARLERDHASVVDGQQRCFAHHFPAVSSAQQGASRAAIHM